MKIEKVSIRWRSLPLILEIQTNWSENPGRIANTFATITQIFVECAHLNDNIWIKMITMIGWERSSDSSREKTNDWNQWTDKSQPKLIIKQQQQHQHIQKEGDVREITMVENWPDYEVRRTRSANLLTLLEYGSWKQRPIKYASVEIEFPARFWGFWFIFLRTTKS